MSAFCLSNKAMVTAVDIEKYSILLCCCLMKSTMNALFLLIDELRVLDLQMTIFSSKLGNRQSSQCLSNACW
jgi:hypothetical protein